jgi:hypothetical protein
MYDPPSDCKEKAEAQNADDWCTNKAEEVSIKNSAESSTLSTPTPVFSSCDVAVHGHDIGS